MGTPKEETKRLIAELGEDYRERLEREQLRRITLDPFLISKFEVTQAQWQRVMGENPSDFKGDDLPVEQVSWEDCRRFCEKTRLALSSEEQWECGCRAGTATIYHSGDTEADLARAGWYNGNSDQQTHPVGQKRPNDFGLYDMHGNLFEWCEDLYESGSEDRVVRGGSWGVSAWLCRSDYRHGYPSIRGFSFVGFRPAAPVP